MLIVHEESRPHFLSVLNFAMERGLLDQFLHQLQFLTTYANGDGCLHDRNKGSNTRCRLYKDFAPYSFQFTIQSLKKPDADGPRTFLKFNDADWQEYISDDRNWNRMMEGGLIYQGPGNPADGSFPTLTVSLAKGTGWFVHT